MRVSSVVVAAAAVFLSGSVLVNAQITPSTCIAASCATMASSSPTSTTDDVNSLSSTTSYRGPTLTGSSTSAAAQELSSTSANISTATTSTTTTSAATAASTTVAIHPGYALPTLIALKHSPVPAVVQIDANGNILLRGVVTAASSTALTLVTWGGEWTVRITSDTAFIPPGVGTALASTIHIGDFVGVSGIVSSTEPSLITALALRDWTLAPLR
ncbi:MAG: hypothetical protein JWN18_442 [Parcubacteria group bacterium]|nr:hypothetical protein [Parcubacteria group bacterium]